MIHLEIQMEIAGLHRRLMVVDRIALNADRKGLLGFDVGRQGDQHFIKPVYAMSDSVQEPQLFVYELAEMTLLRNSEVTKEEIEIMSGHISRALSEKIQRLDAFQKLSA
jgi:hypothetical protein